MHASEVVTKTRKRNLYEPTVAPQRITFRLLRRCASLGETACFIHGLTSRRIRHYHSDFDRLRKVTHLCINRDPTDEFLLLIT